MFGPITIFDKSMLESLNADEALWFDNFYRTNITPLFFVETLADLEKEVATGRTPEHVVAKIAGKVPVQNGLPNVHHRTLALGELLGHPVETAFFPVIAGGQRVTTGEQRGIVFKEMLEFEAFQRWQDGEFLEIERRFAGVWREALSGLDLRQIYDSYHRPRGQRLPDEAAVRAEAERILRRDGWPWPKLTLPLASP